MNKVRELLEGTGTILMNLGVIYYPERLSEEEYDRLICDPGTVVLIDGVPLYSCVPPPECKDAKIASDLAMTVALSTVL